MGLYPTQVVVVLRKKSRSTNFTPKEGVHPHKVKNDRSKDFGSTNRNLLSTKILLFYIKLKGLSINVYRKSCLFGPVKNRRVRHTDSRLKVSPKSCHKKFSNPL